MFLVTLCIFSSNAHAHQKRIHLKTLTMQEAVKIAHEHRPRLQALKQMVRTAQIGEKKAWTDYYPSIRWDTSFMQTRGTQHPLSTTTFSYDQLIYDFAGPQETYKLAKKNTAIEKAKEQAEQNNVQLAVEQAFIQCWRLQKQKIAINNLFNSSSATFEKAVNQSKNDLLKKNDFLKQSQQHALNLSTIYQYEDSITSASKVLEFLMGQQHNLAQTRKKNSLRITRLAWHQQKVPPLKQLSYYRKKAVQYRPEVLAIQKVVELEQQNYHIAVRTRLPRVTAFASAGHDEFFGIGSASGSLSKPRRSYGAKISWNLLDGLKSDYNADLARSRKMTAILNRQETENLVRSEVETSYFALSQEHTKLKAERVTFQQAKNEFTLRKKELDTGLIARTTFETAKTNWASAQFSWVNQLANTAIRKRELLHRCGYLDHHLV